MAVLQFRGTRAELREAIYRIPSMLSGALPDTNDVTRDLKLGMGVALLGKIQDDFVTMSEGATGEMGIQWKPLSLVTIALRRNLTTPAAQRRIKSDFRGLGSARKAKVRELYQQALRFYRGRTGRKEARHAIFILGKRFREIDRTPGLSHKHAEARKRPVRAKIKEIKKILAGQISLTMAKRLAFAAAHVLILRDTGKLLTSLTPGLVTNSTIGPANTNQVLEVNWNGVTVGTNVDYAKYHQSKEPRKLKKDGEPKLPRRQFLPDDGVPIPVGWWLVIVRPLVRGLTSVAFWRQYLGSRAA